MALFGVGFHFQPPREHFVERNVQKPLKWIFKHSYFFQTTNVPILVVLGWVPFFTAFYMVASLIFKTISNKSGFWNSNILIKIEFYRIKWSCCNQHRLPHFNIEGHILAIMVKIRYMRYALIKRYGIIWEFLHKCHPPPLWEFQPIFNNLFGHVGKFWVMFS